MVLSCPKAQGITSGDKQSLCRTGPSGRMGFFIVSLPGDFPSYFPASVLQADTAVVAYTIVSQRTMASSSCSDTG